MGDDQHGAHSNKALADEVRGNTKQYYSRSTPEKLGTCLAKMRASLRKAK